MARLRPINVRRRKPSWDEDDLPPAPLGTRRARLEARLDYITDYDVRVSEQDDRPSPSYHRPTE